MLNLNEFVSNINSIGVSKSSFYEVSIIRGDIETQKVLTARCESAMIPGIQILTTDYKLYGGAPILKIPNSRTNDEIQLTFLETEDFKIRYFFEEWMSQISSFRTTSVAYYNDVCRDIGITCFDSEGNISYVVEAKNAIPTRLDMTSVNWSDYDQLIKFTVNFSYEELETLKLKTNLNVQ